MRRITATLVLFFITSMFFGQTQSPLVIQHLKGDFYIFITYNYYKGERISANGMYLLTNKGAVMFDTPWDSTQFQPLLDSIKIKHHKDVVMCIATHFHGDRTGGLEYYRQHGVRTYTTEQTDELSKKRGMKQAQFLIEKDTAFSIGQYRFETFYPGRGHAPDNIVIWFPKQKVLYGGCLVKSASDTDLGNLGDADVNAYATTVSKVQQHCTKPDYIITGHGDYKNKRSLQHTREMAEALQKTLK